MAPIYYQSNNAQVNVPDSTQPKVPFDTGMHTCSWANTTTMPKQAIVPPTPKAKVVYTHNERDTKCRCKTCIKTTIKNAMAEKQEAKEKLLVWGEELRRGGEAVGWYPAYRVFKECEWMVDELDALR